MPTVHEKYAAATAYVQGVVATVEKQPMSFVVNPTTGRVAWFAGTERAAPFRFQLALLAARWQHAGVIDRDQIVHAAQALAVLAMQTSLPSGCTRDAGLIDMQTPGSTKAEIETVAALIHQLDV